jgi:hypothetical protein
MTTTAIELSETQVSEAGLKNGKSLSVKSLISQYNETTNNVTGLDVTEVEIRAELKKINAELKEKNKKLNERKKELRDNLKTIEKKKSFFLGRASIIQQQMKQLGLQVKQIDIKAMLSAGKEK